jgi:hypothetical protein
MSEVGRRLSDKWRMNISLFSIVVIPIGGAWLGRYVSKLYFGNPNFVNREVFPGSLYRNLLILFDLFYLFCLIALMFFIPPRIG